MTTRLVRELTDGPIDVVGDVHGEIEALRDLLAVLGYTPAGAHAQGRRLVFVGDLCDRGPDSVSVIECVAELVDRGRAQCVLGNHELNVLRGAPKEGNGWFFDTDHDAAKGRFTDCRRATASGRAAILTFFASLPLALERDDLRVIHAAWDDSAIDTLRDEDRGIAVAYAHYADKLEAEARVSGLAERADAEEATHYGAITDPSASVPLLASSGLQDQLYQMGNPLRVLTSGPERVAAEPFFATGKWRMLDRVRWWDDYDHPAAVLFGHYWRWPDRGNYAVFGHWKQDLFEGLNADDWCSPRGNAYCVDFSVGARFHERMRKPFGPYGTRLGAVRWPEREVVFDDGRRCALA
jgi:hypothetical protein